MKKILTFLSVLVLIAFSCKRENYDTDQLSRTAEVVLSAYGPRPVLRGGELRFIGSNLEQVASVTFPGSDPVTDIQVAQSGIPSEIRVTVPQDAEPGILTLTTRTGKTIPTATGLTYIENIAIEGFSPASVYPGDVITLTGDYLNLVHEVIFASNVFVSEEDFLEHTRSTIRVAVPLEAQTGPVGVGDMDETLLEDDALEANRLFTKEELTVGTAGITSVTCTDTRADGSFKAGATVTVEGTHLELVAAVLVSRNPVADYTLSEEEGTLTFVLPDNVSDGPLALEMYSGAQVEGPEVVFVKFVADEPAVASVKAGERFTVTGTDLDLVTGAKLSYTSLQFTVAEDGKSITLETTSGTASGRLVLTSNAGQTFTSEARIEIVSGGSGEGSETVLWEGTCVLGNWEGYIQESDMNAHDWSQVAPGTKLCVAFTTDEGKEADGYQLGFQNGSWGNMEHLGYPSFSAGDTYYEVELDQAMLDEIAADGIIVKGKNMTVTKIYLKASSTPVTPPASETVLWEGTCVLGNWEGYIQESDMNAHDWSQVTPGTKLCVAFTTDEGKEADGYQLGFQNSSLGDMEHLGYPSFSAGDTYYEVALDQATLDEIAADGIIVKGKNMTVTKIYLK